MNLERSCARCRSPSRRSPTWLRAVLARLERPGRRWWRAPVLVALAAAGALFAIPQTRAAILDLLRIGGVEVQRVETRPRAQVRPPALGREVLFATAQRTVDFPLLSPRAPFTAYLDGRMVDLRWKRYVLSQWRGEQLPFAQKQLGPGSQTVGVDVRGDTGLWITGARHEFFFRDPGPARSSRNRVAWPETS